MSHSVVDRSSVDDWMSHSVVDRSSHMVLHDGLVMGSAMVGNTVGSMVDCGDVGSMVSHWGSTVCRGGSLVMDEGGDSCFVDWSFMVGGLWTIDGGRDWGVAVGSSVVHLSVSISISFCFCA